MLILVCYCSKSNRVIGVELCHETDLIFVLVFNSIELIVSGRVKKSTLSKQIRNFTRWNPSPLRDRKVLWEPQPHQSPSHLLFSTISLASSGMPVKNIWLAPLSTEYPRFDPVLHHLMVDRGSTLLEVIGTKGYLYKYFMLHVIQVHIQWKPQCSKRNVSYPC